MHVKPQLTGLGYDFYRSWIGQQIMPALQTVFPSLTPDLGTGQQQAALNTRVVPAPQTEPKMRSWTIDDLYEAIAQRGQVAQVVLSAGVPGGNPADISGPPEKKCEWYQSVGDDGACHAGGLLFWVVAGAGAVGAVSLLRRG